MSTLSTPTGSASDSAASRESHRRHSTLACALACLADPPTLAAVALLLLNDHVLKAAVPSWLTGKLSDVAGAYFLPFLALVALGLLERALPRRFRSHRHAMALAMALSGVWFVALKATPASNGWALGLLGAVRGGPVEVIADRTDLIALAVLPLAWFRSRAVILRWERRARNPIPGRERWLRFIALALASLSALATPPARFPLSYGVVFDVAADAASADVFYASLATRRITEMDPAIPLLPTDHGVRVSEVETTVGTYRSQDGGRTWEPFSTVGGYLWADPHAADRLYVLNEEGLYRVDEGRARLLPVPFDALQVVFFPDVGRYGEGYYAVTVPANEHPLAFDPLMPGALYLADGARILASADGGETWRALAAGEAPGRVTALAVAPTARQTLYAAAGDSVLRSDDGGDSWSQAALVGEEAQIRALAVHPETEEIVYAVGDGILRSVDGGLTWQQVAGWVSLRAIVLHPDRPELVYAGGHTTRGGSDGWTIVSPDGGDSWDAAYRQSGFDVAISPVAPRRVIVALGDQGVAVQDETQAPAASVEAPAVPDAPLVVYGDALAFEPGEPGTLFAVVSDPPALGRSEDGGASWTLRSLTATVDDPPVALASRSRPEEMEGGTTSTDTFAPLVALGSRTAYGLDWQEAGVLVESVPLPALGALTGGRPLLVDPSDADVLLTTAQGGVLRSEDGGEAWAVHVISPAGWPEWASLPITVSALATGALTGEESAGEQSSIQTVLYAVAEVPDGEPGTQAVLRSDDGARTWEVRSWLTGTQHLSALAVHPDDADTVYAGGTGIHRSSDGGVTWESLYPTMTVRALAVVPDGSRVLLAITQEGVARSEDGGLTWTAVCPAGQFDGPAEFLGLSVATTRPHTVVALARPTRPDVTRPSAGLCTPPGPDRFDPKEGWRQGSQGLPVFIEEAH